MWREVTGNPTTMNVIMASVDPVALDSTFCRLVHLDPALVATNVYAHEYGVGTMNEEDIEIIVAEDGAEVQESFVISVAEAVSRWGRPDFDVAREPDFKGQIIMFRFVQPFLDKKPFIIKDKCVSCGICIQACPVEPKAIFFKKGKPAYNHRKCIKCYCCQEMCPKKAIDVKTPLIAKISKRQWKI